MKKFFVIAAAVLILQQWSNIRDFFVPPADYSEFTDSQVILFSTVWCGYCKKTRRLLNKHGVVFTEYDIETSSDGVKMYNAAGGGGVPLLVIKDKIIRGYNADLIIDTLEQLPQ